MNQQTILVRRYAEVARAVMLGCGIQRRACITAARVTTLVFRQFEIEATAIPVSLAVEVKDLKYAYVSGFSDDQRAEMRRTAAEFIDKSPAGPTWAGHLVVVAAGHLIDAAIDQAQSIEHGVKIDPCVLAIPLNPVQRVAVLTGKSTIEAEVRLNSGTPARIVYEPLDDDTWKDSDAWRRDPAVPIVAALIVARMEG